MKREKTRTKSVQFWITPEHDYYLSTLAEEAGLSRAEYMRSLLIQKVSETESPHNKCLVDAYGQLMSLGASMKKLLEHTLGEKKTEEFVTELKQAQEHAARTRLAHLGVLGGPKGKDS